MPVGPHFVENGCEVANPRKHLFADVGVDLPNAKLQFATIPLV